MSQVLKIVRKVIAAAIGIPVFIVGIILIPLPGPGILIAFVGLCILSMEFDSMKSQRDRARRELTKVINAAKMKQKKINSKS